MISICSKGFDMAIWGKKKKGSDLEPEGKVPKTKGKAGPSTAKGKKDNKPKKEVVKGGKVIEEVLVEREVLIKPDRHDKISLGQLERGVSISVKAKEVNGDNFSLYLVDLENLKKYENHDYTKGAILKGTTIAHYEHQIKIPSNSKYYLIVTSGAIKNDRTVQVKASKLSS
jgi:hypothetical protein